MADQLITGTTLIEDKRNTEFGKIWSCAGINFSGDATAANYDSNGNVIASGGTPRLTAPVSLPHGAVITHVVVYTTGAFAANWELKRVDHTGTSTILASAAANSEDSTITNPTVDNENYQYFIFNTDPSNATVHGARIKYTI